MPLPRKPCGPIHIAPSAMAMSRGTALAAAMPRQQIQPVNRGASGPHAQSATAQAPSPWARRTANDAAAGCRTACFDWAYVGSGSWLCENSSARTTRRNIFDQLHLCRCRRRSAVPAAPIAIDRSGVDDVGRAAGRGGDDQPHRPRRIGLRPRDARHGWQRGSTRCHMQESTARQVHGV
jgi:hypothetical protein